MHALKYNKTLKGLDVSNNNIFEDGVKKISELLLENNTLCELVLNGNFVSDEGALSLSPVLQKNKLRALYLQNCHIGDLGIQSLLSSLLLSSPSSSSSSSSPSSPSSPSSSSSSSPISSQSFSQKKGEMKGEEEIGEILRKRKGKSESKLEELDVTHNNFSSRFLIYFQHLKFSSPHINITCFQENFDYSLLDPLFIQQIIQHFGFHYIFSVFLDGFLFSLLLIL